MRIIRTTNPNGTYRYEIDGELHTKASKVLYTHATSYSVGDHGSPVLFHKSEAAAGKARGYAGWVKLAVHVIEDGDMQAARAEAAEIGREISRTVTAEHPAIEAAMQRKASKAAAPAPQRVRRNVDGAMGTFRESTEDGWIVDMDHGTDVLGKPGAFTLVKTPAAPALTKAPRNRAKVRVNDTYPTSTWRGRQGRVQGKRRGDDGNLYVTVDFGNDATWPFLVSELDLVPARCGWCGEELTNGQAKFCSRSCTVSQQNRSRARRR